MASTFTNLLYHIVFSTKERRPLITPNLKVELYPYIGGIIRNQRGVLLEIGGMPDHIHLVVKFRPDPSVSDMLRLIKTNSSGWANERKDLTSGFGWQSGYSAFTVSDFRVFAAMCKTRKSIIGHGRSRRSLSRCWRSTALSMMSGTSGTEERIARDVGGAAGRRNFVQ